MKNSKKGFTLIELLVVIAIIGILSAIVLASLSTARSKGLDAKIQGQLSGMRAQAELYTGGGTAFPQNTCSNTAGTLFESGNNGLWGLFSGITNPTSCVSALGSPSAGSAWAVAAQLSSGSFCVDSTGYASNKNKSGTAYASTPSSDISGTSCQ